MRYRTILSLAATLVLIGGCSDFHPRPLSPAQSAVAFGNRRLDDVKLKEFIETGLNRKLIIWPPRSWDLSMLTLAAIYYSPNLDVARARWRVAEAGKITAGQRPNPGISMSPGFIANPSTSSAFLFGIVPNIPIETAGKRGYRIARAGHLARAAYLDLLGAAWQVRSRLRTVLLNLYLSRESAAVLSRQVAVLKELIKSLAARLAQGEIPRPELTQAQISLDRTRLKWQDTQRRISDDQARLAAAMGVPTNALRQVKISYGFLKRLPPVPPMRKIRRRALLCRPDILAALASYEAAQSALQLEIARQYPDVNLGPGYHFDDSENKWTFGISVTLPVLNQNQGPIAEARARREEAAARFAALQARVVEDLDRGLDGYRETLRKLKVAAAIEASEKKQEEAAQRRLREGETDRLAFLSARLVLYTAVLDHARTFYQAQQALGSLEDALMSPLPASAWLPEHLQTNPRPGENHP